MARVEILVEEASMKAFLTILLPTFLPETWRIDENYFIRSFDGKSDLQKNIPLKIRAYSNWSHENIGVIILHDQDSNDCKILKQELAELCSQNGDCKTMIRIVCKELESWYLGDFVALSKAFPVIKAEKYKNKAKFRTPDSCNAYFEIKKILPEFQKVSGAKKVAPFIDIANNSSESFNQTISGFRRFFDVIVD